MMTSFRKLPSEKRQLQKMWQNRTLGRKMPIVAKHQMAESLTGKRSDFTREGK